MGKQVVRKQLPLVSFSSDRKKLLAIDRLTGNSLWQKDFGSGFSSVFGINQGTWQNVEISNEQSYFPRQNDASVTGMKLVGNYDVTMLGAKSNHRKQKCFVFWVLLLLFMFVLLFV